MSVEHIGMERTNIGKIAFLFPGQGAQKAGMGKDFYENSEIAQAFLNRCKAFLTLI